MRTCNLDIPGRDCKTCSDRGTCLKASKPQLPTLNALGERLELTLEQARIELKKDAPDLKLLADFLNRSMCIIVALRGNIDMIRGKDDGSHKEY